MDTAKALSELKEILQISWDEDSRLLACLERGQARLIGLIDTEIDFDRDIDARALLMNCCRYDYNNCVEYFEENFKTEILRLQLREATKNG